MAEAIQQPFPYSVKIEEGSKGEVKITTHAWHELHTEACNIAVEMFLKTKRDLKSNGVSVLE